MNIYLMSKASFISSNKDFGNSINAVLRRIDKIPPIGNFDKRSRISDRRRGSGSCRSPHVSQHFFFFCHNFSFVIRRTEPFSSDPMRVDNSSMPELMVILFVIIYKTRDCHNRKSGVFSVFWTKKVPADPILRLPGTLCSFMN